MFHRTDTGFYRSSRLETVGWLEHGFGTRRRSLSDAEPMVLVRQVHSNQVVEAGPNPGLSGEADALVTDRASLFLGVKTADCLPLLVADLERQAVAAVHVGWRGTLSRIAERVVRGLARRYGSRTERLLVAIGPGIGQCCFEVGPEVARQFQDLFPERTDLSSRTHINLVEANVRILHQAGVASANIDTADLCTACSPEEFHSYRRDGEKAGRMYSVIAIRRRKGAGQNPRL